ncbi:MAG: hypothetical protein K2I79_02185, partial [Clostridia bacterium]|nr:hypothetical protein [Clostridia bacterium]
IFAVFFATCFPSLTPLQECAQHICKVSLCKKRGFCALNNTTNRDTKSNDNIVVLLFVSSILK